MSLEAGGSDQPPSLLSDLNFVLLANLLDADQRRRTLPGKPVLFFFHGKVLTFDAFPLSREGLRRIEFRTEAFNLTKTLARFSFWRSGSKDIIWVETLFDVAEESYSGP